MHDPCEEFNTHVHTYITFKQIVPIIVQMWGFCMKSYTLRLYLYNSKTSRLKVKDLVNHDIVSKVSTCLALGKENV